MTEEPPDIEWLYVPLRKAACGVSVRLFRDRGGARCAVGFTSAQRLASVLGPEEPFYRLTESAVRNLAAERGVYALVVDPGLVAAPVQAQVEVEVAARARAQAQVDEKQVRPVEVPVRVEVPAHAIAGVPALSAARDRFRSSRAAWTPEATGILVVSAVGGAAALLMQVLG